MLFCLSDFNHDGKIELPKKDYNKIKLRIVGSKGCVEYYDIKTTSMSK
jgi:hypothetical protein